MVIGKTEMEHAVLFTSFDLVKREDFKNECLGGVHCISILLLE